MKRSKRLLLSLAWLVPLLLLAALIPALGNGAAATSDTGLVTGKVVDQNGDGLAGVNVALSENGIVANHTVTNTDGGYGMRVAPGMYELVVFDKTVNSSVFVIAGQSIDLGATQIYSSKNYAWIVIDVTIVIGGAVLLMVAWNRDKIRQKFKKKD
jgi:hypothetical protein